MDTTTNSEVVKPEVHVLHDAPTFTRKLRAAKAAMKFIAKTARSSNPADADELRRRVWILYRRMRRAKILVAPKLTKHLIIAKFGRAAIVDVKLN